MIHLGQVQCAVTIIAIVLNLFKSGIENCEIAIQRQMFFLRLHRQNWLFMSCSQPFKHSPHSI